MLLLTAMSGDWIKQFD